MAGLAVCLRQDQPVLAMLSQVSRRQLSAFVIFTIIMTSFSGDEEE